MFTRDAQKDEGSGSCKKTFDDDKTNGNESGCRMVAEGGKGRFQEGHIHLYLMLHNPLEQISAEIVFRKRVTK